MNRYSPERLEEVGRFLKLNFSKEKDLQEIVEFAAEICNSPIAMITLMDGDTQFVKFHSGVDINEVDYSNTFCQYTLRKNDLLMVPDATKDYRLADNPFVQGSKGIKFYAGLPLTSQNGNAIGTLCVFDLENNELSEVQQQILRSLSQQVTRLLEFDLALQILKEQYEDSVSATNTFLTYFQSSSSCNLLMDKNMTVIAYNQALADLVYASYQISLDEGMKITDYVHPEFLTEFINYFNKALHGEVHTVERHLDYATGKICWFICFEPAHNIEGEIIGVSFNATDISKSVSDKEQLDLQIEAISKINEVQANQLMKPIDIIVAKTKEIDSLPGPNSIAEFNLLKLAVNELLEKKDKVIDLTANH